MNFLSKLVKKNKNYGLSNLNGVFQIPKRDYFKNEEQELLNVYKKQYLKVLSSKRTITSIDIRRKEIEDSMLMYTSLLSNIIIYNKENFITKDIHKLSKNNLKKIQIVKLKLYYNFIIKLEKETLLRLVALNELYLDKKHLLSNNRKNVIINEINNLISTFIIFQNQKKAISLEIDKYFKYSEFIDESNHENISLYKRRNKLLELVSTIQETANIEDANIITEIVLIESELEIFAYKNQDYVKTLKKELDAIISLKKELNYKELFKRINTLELKYKIFDEFGKNLVNKEELKKLYEIKFKIITSNLNYKTNLMNGITNEFELTCYKEIIFRKIELILKGNNPFFNDIFEEKKQAITFISNILKNNEKQYNIEKIISNTYLLSLLLSFDKLNGFNKFINEFKIPKKECKNIYFYEDELSWQDEIPLKSILALIEYEDIRNKPDIYKLSKLRNEKLGKLNEFYLPEGIETISACNKPRIPFSIKTKEKYELEENLKNEFVERAKNKILVMPSTLKKVNKLSWFKNLIGIRFNEGLETLNFPLLNFSRCYASVEFPTTLKNISYDYSYNIFIIEKRFYERERNFFLNNKDSGIFNNDKVLYDFVKTFFIAIDLGEYKHKIVPLFDHLVLEGKPKSIIIPKKDLVVTTSRNINSELNNYTDLKDEEIIEIIENLRVKKIRNEVDKLLETAHRYIEEDFNESFDQKQLIRKC